MGGRDAPVAWPRPCHGTSSRGSARSPSARATTPPVASAAGRPRIVVGRGIVEGDGVVASLVEPSELRDTTAAPWTPHRPGRARLGGPGGRRQGPRSRSSRCSPTLPDAELTVLGDGPARRELEARAARLGVAARIDWRGFVADRSAYLDASRRPTCSSIPRRPRDSRRSCSTRWPSDPGRGRPGRRSRGAREGASDRADRPRTRAPRHVGRHEAAPRPDRDAGDARASGVVRREPHAGGRGRPARRPTRALVPGPSLALSRTSARRLRSAGGVGLRRARDPVLGSPSGSSSGSTSAIHSRPACRPREAVPSVRDRAGAGVGDGRHRRAQRSPPARSPDRQRHSTRWSRSISRSSSRRTDRPTVSGALVTRLAAGDDRIRLLELPRGGQTAAQRAIFDGRDWRDRGAHRRRDALRTRLSRGADRAVRRPARRCRDGRLDVARGRPDRDVAQRGCLLAVRTVGPTAREPGGLADGGDRSAPRRPGDGLPPGSRPRLDGPPAAARGPRRGPGRPGRAGGDRERSNGRRACGSSSATDRALRLAASGRTCRWPAA